MVLDAVSKTKKCRIPFFRDTALRHTVVRNYFFNVTFPVHVLSHVKRLIYEREKKTV